MGKMDGKEWMNGDFGNAAGVMLQMYSHTNVKKGRGKKRGIIYDVLIRYIFMMT